MVLEIHIEKSGFPDTKVDRMWFAWIRYFGEKAYASFTHFGGRSW